MSKVDELVINYAIYEDATEYLGTTEVTLPDLEYMTEELSGAGIAGNIEEIIIGHLNAMSTTFNFRTVTEAAVTLMEPRVHRIDLRVAQQKMNLLLQVNKPSIRYLYNTANDSTNPIRMHPTPLRPYASVPSYRTNESDH